MTHLDPRHVRGPRPNLLAAAHHRRLVRAGFHPTPHVAPVHSRQTTSPRKEIP